MPKIYVGYYWYGGGSTEAGSMTVVIISTDKAKVEEFIADPRHQPLHGRPIEYQIAEIDDGECYPSF